MLGDPQIEGAPTIAPSPCWTGDISAHRGLARRLRQNSSQDNLNKKQIDHYRVSGRWLGWWRPWRSRRRRLRSHDVASPLASQNLLAMLLEDLSNQLTLVFRLSSMTRAPWRRVMFAPGHCLHAAS
jgi:hypothetical protein